MKILGNHIQLDLIKNLIRKKQFPNSLILSGQKGIGKSLIAKNTAYCLVGCIKLDELIDIKELISHDILFICKDNLEEKIKVLDSDIQKVSDRLVELEREKANTLATMNALQGAKSQCVTLIKELHNDEDQSNGSSDDS